MQMDKVIFKAALSTLMAILLLCTFLLSVLCFAFPSTMMKLTYDVGLDSASVGFASTAYERSGRVYYIAYATDVAIESENDKKVVLCGKQLISDEEFSAYAGVKNQELQREDGAYEQYVYGKICSAEYRLGAKTLAVEDARSFVSEGFPASNALIAVALETVKANDTETASSLLSVLRAILEERITTLNTKEAEELNKLISAVETWLNG